MRKRYLAAERNLLAPEPRHGGPENETDCDGEEEREESGGQGASEWLEVSVEGHAIWACPVTIRVHRFKLLEDPRTLLLAPPFRMLFREISLRPRCSITFFPYVTLTAAGHPAFFWQPTFCHQAPVSLARFALRILGNRGIASLEIFFIFPPNAPGARSPLSVRGPSGSSRCEP